MPLPHNLSEEDLKIIIGTAYWNSRNVPREGVWSDVAKMYGMEVTEKDFDPEDFEPVELDHYERTDMIESTVSFCRSKKDGRIYTKSLEDYAREELEEELGREPTEEEISEFAWGFCDIGGCDPPREYICGEDEFFGDYHDHPNYPVSPSCNDINGAVKDNVKVMCIGSGGRFACVFIDPENDKVGVPCRSGDVPANKLCFDVITEKEDAWGNIVEEEFRVCPDEFLRGHEEAWIHEVRRRVRDGDLLGVCYYDDKFGKRVICDFGDRGIITFDIDEID